MSQRLAELCSLLVESAYGDLAAQIFTTLAEHGRLTFASLLQLSGIPRARLGVVLTTLIQHHIVLYCAPREWEPTHFQIDWQAAYALVRIRRLLNVVIDEEGEAAGRIVSVISQLGHTSVGDLAEEYDLRPSSKRDSGIDVVESNTGDCGYVDGTSKEHVPRSDQSKVDSEAAFHDTLRRLLAKGFLAKVTERSFVPPSDLQERLRSTVAEENRELENVGLAGSKKDKALKAKMHDLKRKWAATDDNSRIGDVASHGEIQHPEAATMSNKRIKTTHAANGINHDHCHVAGARSIGSHHRVDKLPASLVLRVDFARFNTMLRCKRFEQTAHRYLGPATAAIYGALLRAVDSAAIASESTSKDSTGYDSDEEGEERVSVSVVEVSEHLDSDIVLESKSRPVKANSKLTNGTHKHRGKAHTIICDEEDAAQLGIKQEVLSESEDEPAVDGLASLKQRKKRLAHIEMHLDILAEHPHRFCMRKAGISKFEVDMAAMAKLVVGIELETVINARCGKIPTRFIRILREAGKVDVQQIANMTMSLHNDVCAWLTSLQFAGLAHSAELAKDNSYNTARAVHLWWFDEKGVASQHLERTYQAMARTLQRLRFERETRFKAAVDKAERMDVKGREHELLNQQDREELGKWQEVEERMLVQVSRLDDVVATLRDAGDIDASITMQW